MNQSEISYPWYSSTVFLYVIAIIAWGSTWYGLKLQLGVVAPEVSVCYRMGIASIILLCVCAIQKKSFKFLVSEHVNFFVQGLCMYSLTYMMAYHAGARIPSGLNAVLFSTIVIFNVINSAIFLKNKLSLPALAGGAIGLLGLTLVFLPEVMDVHIEKATLIGMGLSLTGGYIGSVGNIFSVKSQSTGMKVLRSNAMSMAYGALIAGGYAFSQGYEFTFDPSPVYIGSLFYLAIVGTILTFGSFLTVLGRLGPEKASYPMVLIPVVALIFSVILEGVSWEPMASVGVALMLFGNVIITGRTYFMKKFRTPRL